MKTEEYMTLGSLVIPDTLRPLDDEELDSLDDLYSDAEEDDMFEEELVIVCLLKTIYDLRSRLAAARNP